LAAQCPVHRLTDERGLSTLAGAWLPDLIHALRRADVSVPPAERMRRPDPPGERSPSLSVRDGASAAKHAGRDAQPGGRGGPSLYCLLLGNLAGDFTQLLSAITESSSELITEIPQGGSA
jgi:hypothetical protein